MNETQYEIIVQRLEDTVHKQNCVIDEQYSTILHLEQRLRLYEQEAKVKKL